MKAYLTKDNICGLTKPQYNKLMRKMVEEVIREWKANNPGKRLPRGLKKTLLAGITLLP